MAECSNFSQTVHHATTREADAPAAFQTFSSSLGVQALHRHFSRYIMECSEGLTTFLSNLRKNPSPPPPVITYIIQTCTTPCHAMP